MFVNVGPFRYRVQLVHGHIDHEGEPCFGLCDNLRQQILISDVPPERQRLQVFFHELMHAWWYHFDVDAGDQEAVVDLVGIAMTDFVMQALRKLDHAELERVLCPTATLAATPQQPPARAKSARATSLTTPDPPSPQLPPSRSDAPNAIHATATIEQSGWRIRLYEPTAGEPRAAG